MGAPLGQNRPSHRTHTGVTAMYVESIDWSWAFMCVAALLLGIGWVLVLIANDRLAKQIRRLEHHKATLQGACEEARQTFRRYARIHFAKRGGAETDKKGYENEQLSLRMERALKLSGYVILGPLQQSFADLAKRMQNL
jgi:hypothetical protein